DPAVGMMGYQARKLAAALGLKGDLINAAAKLLLGVYQTWWECDASLVEINPLCLVGTADGAEAVMAVDAKIGLDDNALYRHANIQAMRDLGEEAPLEGNNVQAGKTTLAQSGLTIVSGDSMADAAQKVVKAVGK